MSKDIKWLNIIYSEAANKYLNNLTDYQLESIYFEIVDIKKYYPIAYKRLYNELNKRKDDQINKM